MLATHPGGTARLREHAGSAGMLVLATGVVSALAGVLVGLANQPYFDLVNRFFDARETVARGVLFSSWLLIVGGPFVVWRPAGFGFRLGDSVREWRLIAVVVAAAAALTGLVVAVNGSTPYSDASPVIETVVVPFTEELVFRGVLLTATLAVMGRLVAAPMAAAAAIIFNGLGFGLAHLANATSLELSFVIAQATFASCLGVGCAWLAVRTRSIVPAMLLHAVVNAVVVAI